MGRMAFHRLIQNVLQYEMTLISIMGATAFPFMQPTSFNITAACHCRVCRTILLNICLFHLLCAPCWPCHFLFPNILVHNVSMLFLSTPDICNIMFICFFFGRLFVNWRRNGADHNVASLLITSCTKWLCGLSCVPWAKRKLCQ